MAQVDGGADILVDLEVARYEGEGRHVGPWSPGGGVGFAGIERVVVQAGEGELEGFQVVGGKFVGGWFWWDGGGGGGLWIVCWFRGVRSSGLLGGWRLVGRAEDQAWKKPRGQDDRKLYPICK